ncbi:MAG: co-chaperone GroES [Planctomycetes bacterium]|nr:co-chaperone GroES [Planctomycetota bacterium]
MAIKPLDDRVLIEPVEAEEKTPGGIVLPDTAKEKPMRGKIVATGPGKLLETGKRPEMTVKKGDQVIYGKYSGTEVKVKGKEYIIVRESELLAKVE